ncbi:unnamed protein product [Miscanthus lutarioriparius]|uniref:Uncharacterized protein n=1 Tax=Miscanthus lutarioriparius TaxID=422564 RepID=A0A811NU06_9POAL|nr:unnamed protein product [Miscanthus lutarioriparius]
MPRALCLLLVVLVCRFHLPPPLMMAAAATFPGVMARSSDAAPQSSDCPSLCGDVEISYPFGIGDNCSLHNAFTITCNTSFSRPPRPYWGNLEVINISVETGELRVFSPVSFVCYDNSSSSSSSPSRSVSWIFRLRSPFLISTRRNVFTAIGCSTQALLLGRKGYFTGCTTTCQSLDLAAEDRAECTGLGCCQAAISGKLDTMQINWDRPSYLPDNQAWTFSPCSYFFVAEKSWYVFSRQDLVGVGEESFSRRVGNRTIPLVLDWAVVNGSCNASATEVSACVSTHSYCVDATQGPGYLCSCSMGYKGNPYITDGCKNIDECRIYNPCGTGSICHDTPGGYKCICKFWYRPSGAGCQRIFSTSTVWTIIATCVLAFLIYLGIRDMKKRKQRNFFNKNGGELLKDVGIIIFTERELKKMTNGYKEIIGEGAFGKVYMGTTMDGTEQVAIKCSFAKSKQLRHDEFRNEITFQFKIDHANVVRLIGCCLETNVPKLVFEFVPNGSLCDLLHGARRQELPLPARLHIAIGAAEALSYMHSHGDMNYIDPTYIKTGRFTEKSDVYSFGVVLLELITRKTAKYDESNSLPIDFVKCCKEQGNGRAMYDREILMAHHAQECLDKIGALAVQCLKEDVDERPTMAQVLKQLEQVKVIACGGSSSC